MSINRFCDITISVPDPDGLAAFWERRGLVRSGATLGTPERPRQLTLTEGGYRHLAELHLGCETEADLADIELGTPVSVTLRAYPNDPVEGKVTFVYPDIKPETRTARVRIELPNRGGQLKIDMYADVVFRPGANRAPVVSVTDSAVIDSGTQQLVLVAKGEGRFEPRAVKLGRRGEGHIEVRQGLSAGEEVVTTATFLIDAESNLRSALRTFGSDAARKETSR